MGVNRHLWRKLLVIFVAEDDNQWTECLRAEEDKYPTNDNQNESFPYPSGTRVNLAVNYLQEAEQERTEDNSGVYDGLGLIST